MRVIAPASEPELADTLRSHTGRLAIRGGASRHLPPAGVEQLDTRGLTGIVDHEPAALTVIVRAGTPLAELEARLAAERQMLAFEPTDLSAHFGGRSTIGGVLATNASGPRRLLAGAARDHLLGLRMVDGRGRVLKSGGRVMKNVTGLDLGKLLAGSEGRLAVITELALKAMPIPEVSSTIRIDGIAADAALALFGRLMATPCELAGALHRGSSAWLRLEGLERSVAHRQSRVFGELAGLEAHVLPEPEAAAVWQAARTLAWFQAAGEIWQVVASPTAMQRVMDHLGDGAVLDWGGNCAWTTALRDPAALAAALAGQGFLRCVRGAGRRLPAPSGRRARIEAGLARAFDPRGLFVAADAPELVEEVS